MTRRNIISLDDVKAPNGFQILTANAASLSRTSLNVGDVNGDGLDDLIIGAPNARWTLDGLSSVFVILGAEAAPVTNLRLSELNDDFAYRIDIGTPYHGTADSVAVGDYNGDGLADIAVGSQVGSTISLIVSGPGGLEALDARDGRNDGVIVGASLGAETISYLTVGESYSPTMYYLKSIGLKDSIAFADLNGDGKDELVLLANGRPIALAGGAQIAHLQDLSDLEAPDVYALDAPSARRLLVGDIDGDDFDDIALSRTYGNISFSTDILHGAPVAETGVLASDGTIIAYGAPAANGGGYSGMAIGDLNGDGFDDVGFNIGVADSVIQSNPYAHGRVALVFGGDKRQAHAPFITPAELDGVNGLRLIGGLGERVGEHLAMGDVNGDGFDDLLISGASGAYLVFGKADGFQNDMDMTDMAASDGVRLLSIASARGPENLTIADINGDGYGDIAVIGTRQIGEGDAAEAVTILFGGPDGPLGAREELAEGENFQARVGTGGYFYTIFVATSADDIFRGASGDDIFKGLLGNNIFDGGAGQDLLDLRGVEETIIARMDAHSVRLMSGDRATVTGIEAVTGGTGDDFLRGDDGGMRLLGWSGDDNVTGGAGDDELQGNAGDDVLRAGAGADVALGGDGADVIKGDSGDDLIQGEAGDDILVGGAGLDRLEGGAGDDVIYGGSQDDALYGHSGDDRLVGQDGDDRLMGGAGADVLKGGAGADVLNGGADFDRLIGGQGADTFVFEQGLGYDRVFDFQPGIDRLDFSEHSAVHAFADLIVTPYNQGVDTLITVASAPANAERIVLVGVDLSEIFQTDFLF